MSARVPERLHHPDVEGIANGASHGYSASEFSRERKHPVSVVDLPSQTISMTIGALEPGQKSNRHRHNYETLIYVLEGRGESMIEDRVIRWKAGDAFYVPVWAWHHHQNLETEKRTRYLACENAPLLQNLGRLDIREEEP